MGHPLMGRNMEQEIACCLSVPGELAALMVFKLGCHFSMVLLIVFWSTDNHRNLSSSASVAQIHSRFGP